MNGQSMADLYELVFDCGCVKSFTLRHITDMGDPTSVQLVLEGGEFWFSAVPEDDTLSVYSGVKEDLDVIPVLQEQPWTELVGGKVVGAWLLTNCLGFDDGAQLELVAPDGMKYLLQMLVVASVIEVIVVKRDARARLGEWAPRGR